MTHSTHFITSQVMLQYVGDGTKRYNFGSLSTTPFVFKGTTEELNVLLNSGDFIRTDNNPFQIADSTLAPSLPTNGYYDQIKALLYALLVGSIPATPTGVTATAGNNQVAVAWSASTGATGYNVKRSTASGSEVTLAAGGNVSGTSFIDTTAANGTLYYYVVSALNVNGESANSSEVSATPAAPTPVAYSVDFTTSGAGPAKLPYLTNGKKFFYAGGFATQISNKFSTVLANIYSTPVGSIELTESNVADATISATFGSGMGGILVFRATDYKNYWFIYRNGASLTLYKSVNCALTAFGSASGFTDNTLVSVVTSGSTINVYVGGSSTAAITNTGDNFNQTATKHGLGSFGQALITFNTFAVTPAGGATYIAPTYNPFSNALIAFFGNSITSGSGVNTQNQAYPSQVIDALGGAAQYSFVNAGGNGLTSQQLQSNYSNQFAVLKDAASYPKAIAVVSEVTNDLAINGVTQATALANYQNLLLSFKADYDVVIGVDTLPRGSGFSGGGPVTYTPSTFETARSGINASMKTWATTHINGYVDLSALAVSAPGAYTDTTLYNGDQIHPVVGGAAQIANAVKAVIQTFLP